MNNPNPPSKDIDIKTQEGLDLLKAKAKSYGHYADNLQVLELIGEIEKLRLIEQCNEVALSAAEDFMHMNAEAARKKFGW